MTQDSGLPMHASGLGVTKEQHRALIDASNLLCEFVSKHLPDGWDITMVMRRGEAEMNITDANGTEHFVDSPGHGYSTLVNMCEAAHELDMIDTEEP